MLIDDIIYTNLQKIAQDHGLVLVRSEELGEDQGGYMLISRESRTTTAVWVRHHKHPEAPAQGDQ